MLLILYSAGSAGIACKQALEAVVMSSPYGSLHAHMGLHPADHQLFYGILPQQFQQSGPQKGIHVIFRDYGFSGKGLYKGMDISARFKVMPDMVNRKTPFPERVKEETCINTGRFGILQLHPAPGEVKLLDIYDQKGRFLAQQALGTWQNQEKVKDESL
jgi:hypothetical protein